MSYNPLQIQKKWQKIWDDGSYIKQKKATKEKYYCLDMFPYPSGSGLHVGHWRGYVLSDIYARIKWLQGHDILHPMGWDAFGLPAENFALQNGVHPCISTAQNIAHFKKQLMQIGALYDWSKEINTTDPEYYKWTQWIFLQMYHAGLAYQQFSEINWCPSCKTGLANEEVIKGSCERCKNTVEQKRIRQWILKITRYADKLLEGLDKLNWPEKVKTMQRNWIGKSSGLEITFQLAKPTDSQKEITVFTTCPETIYGVTFLALASNHPLLEQIVPEDLQEDFKNKSTIFKATASQPHIHDIRGVFTETYAIHPLTNEHIPIYASSYVLKDYGTGVVMGVPAHDERDYNFAKHHSIAMRSVIQNPSGDNSALYEGDGMLMHSAQFDGAQAKSEGKEALTAHLIQRKVAKKVIRYKLRDWVFSRQRYWGEPIPLVHCAHCGVVPVPESELPIVLPEVEKYEPTGTGESPLADIDWWVNTSCPSCKGPAKRETNTMPQWAGSCWYFLRYPNPHLSNAPFSQEDMLNWLPVDLYVGGIEHAILHLLYARFYVKFLHEKGFLPFDEPFSKLFNQGMLTKYSEKTGLVEKMSKSKGNVVSPDDLTEKYGADVLRLYIIFIGPPDLDCEWQDSGLEGCNRFLRRLWCIITDPLYSYDNDQEESIEAQKAVNQFLKKYNDRIENMHPNTAVASAMEFVNVITQQSLKLSQSSKEKILIALSAMAPHTAAELLEKISGKSLLEVSWPSYDQKYVTEESITIAVQVQGKTRATLVTDIYASEHTIVTQARELIQKWLEEEKIVKTVFIPGKIVNFVIAKAANN